MKTCLWTSRVNCFSSRKAFEAIPKLPHGWVPLVGNGWQLVRAPAGRQQMWKNVLALRDQHCPGQPMMRLRLPQVNSREGGRALWLFRYSNHFRHTQ